MGRIQPTPSKNSKIREALSPIYDESENTFLHYLRQFGQVGYAASMTGLARRTFYQRRERHPNFADAWDDAIEAFEDELTTRVVQTGLEMGTGKWVQCFNEETGEPELDDDFEAVYRFETQHVDPRVLNKLLGLRMKSMDGPSQTNVQVNNSTKVQAPQNKPRLVRPSIAETAQPVVESAQVVQASPQETGGVQND
jgi:hypothetical protein